VLALLLELIRLCTRVLNPPLCICISHISFTVYGNGARTGLNIQDGTRTSNPWTCISSCSMSLKACLNIHSTRHYACSHRCEASTARRYCEIGGRKSCSIPIAIVVIDGRFALPYRALRRIFVLGSRFLQPLVVPLYSAEVY
jgi:hypothetical protein